MRKVSWPVKNFLCYFDLGPPSLNTMKKIKLTIINVLCWQYSNLQRQFVEAFQYAFLKYMLWNFSFFFFSWLHLCRESFLWICSLEAMVPLRSMDFPGIGFEALTLTHLHFPLIQSPLLIWFLRHLKRICRSGLADEVI